MTDASPPQTPSGKQQPKWLRIAGVAVAYAVLLSLGFFASDWLMKALGLQPGEGDWIVNDNAIWLGIAIYTILLAIPFVPGIEISLALLAAFGGAVAFQVYLGTLAAFLLAYAAGRVLPLTVLTWLFRSVGLTSAERMIERLRPLSGKERLAMIVEQAPSRYIPLLLRYRYVALVLAMNLPGNAVLGGGGGIALLAGLSGMFSFPFFVLATGIAALPIPVAATLLQGVF